MWLSRATAPRALAWCTRPGAHVTRVHTRAQRAARPVPRPTLSSHAHTVALQTRTVPLAPRSRVGRGQVWRGWVGVGVRCGAQRCQLADVRGCATTAAAVRHASTTSGAAAPHTPATHRAVLLLGSAGTGKGTQARLLAQLGCRVLDWGQARRAAVEAQTPAGVKVAALGDLVARGTFIPDALAAEVFVEALAGALAGAGSDTGTHPAVHGAATPGRHSTAGEAGTTPDGASVLVLDGFPRTVEQLALMHQHASDAGAMVSLDLVLVLHAPRTVLLRRTHGRLIHKASGRTYHPVECPPRVPMRDDVTGEPLQERLLATTMTPEAALEARCAIEAAEMSPLVRHLEGLQGTTVVHLDGGEDEAWFDVHRRVPQQLHADVWHAITRHVLRQAPPAGACKPTIAAPPREPATETPSEAPARTRRESTPLRHIAVAGLGPHARRLYYPLLQDLARRRGVRVSAVVDMEHQQGVVDAYLRDASTSTAPRKILLVPEAARRSGTVHPPVHDALMQLRAQGQLDGIVVSSEPSSHEPYLRWALQHGVHALVDKPPTLPVPFDPARIATDFDAVLDVARHSSSNVAVTVQRRCHPGYQLIHSLVSDVVRTWGVPVSYIDIYHGDGMWCMPGELATREQHPYKYGYGKLMHSGYHFLDLLLWLQSINDAQLPERRRHDAVDVTAMDFTPADAMAQVSPAALRAMTGASAAEVEASWREYHDAAAACAAEGGRLGELNMHALLQFMRSSDSTGGAGAGGGCGATGAGARGRDVVCTASVNLLQNSFSRRAWFQPRADVYKGNGRVRHERLVLNVGNLMSVHVHSYQSHEAGQPDAGASAGAGVGGAAGAGAGAGADGAPSPASTRDLLANLGLGDGWDGGGLTAGTYGAGHEDHFDVTIYRNSAIVGGPAFEHIPVGQLVSRRSAQGLAPPWAQSGVGLAHNECGRAHILEAWAAGDVVGTSALREQRPTMELAARVYAELWRSRSGNRRR